MDWPVCRLQFCNLAFGKFAPAKYQKVNENSNFDTNFDIRRQLEHFEYDMNRTLANFAAALVSL